MDLKKNSLGGIATAKKLRKEALERYYENPKTCRYCKQVILVKGGQRIPDVRKKNFCTQSCSGKYFGNKRKNQTKLISKKKTKVLKRKFLADKSKGEVFESSKNYFSARAVITKHARNIYKKSCKDIKCVKCGYTLHVETAHIKSVMSFDDSILIKEINSIENLIGLCPTHHWEFDNGFLKI